MSLREDVETLAAMERRTARAGERASAEWCAGRLRECGAQEARVERFYYRQHFGPVHALHFAAAALGRLPATAALASYELDYSGRAQPLRRLLGAGEGANVVAQVGAAGALRRTLVLVAHHDAANTGLMWHPRVSPPGGRSGQVPFSLLPELAMALIATGPRRLRTGARAVLGVAAALVLEASRGATVPGASDNATGVAAVLELTGRLDAEPLPGTEVVVILPGSEESGMGGMAAWLRTARGGLDPATTLVLGLDTLGAGEPVVLSAEGPLWRVRYREQDLELAEAAARGAGLDPPRRFRLGGWTDPGLAALAGLPAISLLSMGPENRLPNYHVPTDTPDRVDWDSVEACTALAEAVARSWARG